MSLIPFIVYMQVSRNHVALMDWYDRDMYDYPGMWKVLQIKFNVPLCMCNVAIICYKFFFLSLACNYLHGSLTSDTLNFGITVKEHEGETSLKLIVKHTHRRVLRTTR